MPTDTETTTISQLVRQRRKALGLSQGDAAHRAGISRRAWSEIELGHRRGSDETLSRIEPVIGVPPGSLAALEVTTTDPSLTAIKREVVGIINTFTRDELKQVRVFLVRQQFNAAKAKLEQYEEALSDGLGEDPTS